MLHPDMKLSTVFSEAVAFVKAEGAKLLKKLEAGKDLIMYYQALTVRLQVGKVKPTVSEKSLIVKDKPSLTKKCVTMMATLGRGAQHVQRLWLLGDVILRTEANYTAFCQGGNFSDSHRIIGKIYKEVLEGLIEDGDDIEATLAEYRKETGKTTSKGKTRASKGTADAKQKATLETLGAILGTDTMSKLADVLGYETSDGYAEFWKLLTLHIEDRHEKLNSSAKSSKQKTG